MSVIPEADTAGRMIPSWQTRLESHLGTPAMQDLRAFLKARMAAGATVFPPSTQWFAALNAVPFEGVRVVILGQDPYHGPGQAHGLSFSVPDGVPAPPSLVNIFKELQREYGVPIPASGNLQRWADQGVLLLNSVLTVEQGAAGAHVGKGWEGFTDEIVRQLATDREGLVFMLWGAYAQKKGAMIDRFRHCILRAPHPSPLSAHRGFLGCDHFEKANRYLQMRGERPIFWAA